MADVDGKTKTRYRMSQLVVVLLQVVSMSSCESLR